MKILEFCAEEIALEGLDGISINSLWLRLLSRHDFTFPLDDYTKRYLWRYIRQHSEMSFFQIPEQRPDIKLIDKQTEEEDIDLYPVVNINKDEKTNEKVWGSCQFYYVRSDKTVQIKSDAKYISLETVLEEFSSSLIIVASAHFRVQTLIGSIYVVEVFLSQMLNSPWQYLVLERIGRSRCSGESSLGKYALHEVFKMRAKDMFYITGQLEKIGVITRQTYSVTIASKLRYGSLTTLNRYATPTEPPFYLAKMRELIDFLETLPDRKAKGTEIRLKLGLDGKAFKKLLAAYDGVVTRLSLLEPNQRYAEFQAKEKQKAQASVLVESNESSDPDGEATENNVSYTQTKKKYKTQGPRPTIMQRYYKLEGKISFNEETGKWRKVDEDVDDESDEEGEVRIDWVQQNLFRTKFYEILRIIRESKSKGVSVNDLRKALAMRRKLIEPIMVAVRKTNMVKFVTVTSGKMRRRLYVWASEQHESNIEYIKFRELTGINVADVPEKERMVLGERNIRRMNIILTMLEERTILQRYELLKAVRPIEREQGYKFEMDRKCLVSLVNYLADRGVVKVYTSLLTSPGRQPKEVRFVCHRSIDTPENEILRMLIKSVQEKFVHTCYEAGKKSELFDESDDAESNVAAASESKKRKFIPYNVAVKRRKKEADTVSEPRRSGERKRRLSTDISPKSRGKKSSQASASAARVRVSSHEIYGLQGKYVRTQILHEFLSYWLFYYKGELVQRSTLSKNVEEREPPVFLDEESWKRYIRPPPVKEGVVQGWFLLSDVCEAMPLSLICMICMFPYTIDGLDEYLSHPLKRHYLLNDLPSELNGALRKERRISVALFASCQFLCVFGITSMGPAAPLSMYGRLDDTYFYLHSSTKLLDTSTTPYRFRVVAQPLSRYIEYLYKFDCEENVILYWIHLRAITASSRMGHRNCKTAEDIVFEKDAEKTHHRPQLKVMFKIQRVQFADVVTDGSPIEPRTGAAGYHPLMFTFRVTSWRLNREKYASWFFDELRRRMAKYEKEISKRVSSLSISWNTFLNFTNDFAKHIIRMNYRSPFCKSTKNVMKNPRHVNESFLSTENERNFRPKAGKQRVYSAAVLEKKKNPFMDNVDRNSMNLKRRLRARFSLRENRMLLLVRAVALIVCPNQRMWVNPLVVRDLLHKFVPESRDKTTKTLLQHSTRDICDNQSSYDSMMMMSKQLKENQEIRAIRKKYPMLSFCTNDEKSRMFTELFEKAIQIFNSGSNVLSGGAAGKNLEECLKDFTFMYDSKEFSSLQSNDVKNVSEIFEASVFNMYLSLLSLSRRDGTFSGQLHEIYKNFPHACLSNVVGKLRRDGLIISILPHRVYDRDRRGQQLEQQELSDTVNSKLEVNYMPAAGGLRRHLTFSFYFRHFFYHKYHINLTEQAIDLYHLLKSRPEELHDILRETPGFVMVLVHLMIKDMIDINLKLPDVLVAFPETCTENETNTSFSAIIDSDDSDEEAACVSKALLPKTTSGVNYNKTLLYKLRSERLEAVENADFRLVNMRLNSCGLNPSEILIKFKSTPEKGEDDREAARNSAALKKILLEIPYECSTWNEYKISLYREDFVFKQTAIRVYDAIDTAGSLGICESDLLKEFANLDRFDEALQHILNDKRIVKVGSERVRYVSLENVTPWCVSSFKMPKELRSAAADANVVETKGKPVRFLPRPWIRPDGTLNWAMLKWLCEGIFLRFLSLPGLLEKDICEQFAGVLQPTSVSDLLNFLVEVGCLVRRIDVLTNRQPTLFGRAKAINEKVVSYHVAIDGVTKLAEIFAKSPLPDFLSISSSGSVASIPKNIFATRKH